MEPVSATSGFKALRAPTASPTSWLRPIVHTATTWAFALRRQLGSSHAAVQSSLDTMASIARSFAALVTLRTPGTVLLPTRWSNASAKIGGGVRIAADLAHAFVKGRRCVWHRLGNVSANRAGLASTVSSVHQATIQKVPAMWNVILEPPATSTAFAGRRVRAFAMTFGKVKAVPTARSMAALWWETIPPATLRALHDAQTLLFAMDMEAAQPRACATVILVGTVGPWYVGIKNWRRPTVGSARPTSQIAISSCPWVLDSAVSAACSVRALTLGRTTAGRGALVMGFACVTTAGAAWTAKDVLKVFSPRHRLLHRLAQRSVWTPPPATPTGVATTMAFVSAIAVGRARTVIAVMRIGFP